MNETPDQKIARLEAEVAELIARIQRLHAGHATTLRAFNELAQAHIEGREPNLVGWKIGI